MFFDIIASFIPAPMAIYFNINYSLSLLRLRFKDIFGTTTEKTVEGALMKVLCFDKTGTLTDREVNIKGICKVDDKGKIAAEFNDVKDN